MWTGELACTYASVILHDDGIVINITALAKVANVKIDSYWPSLFSKLFETRSIEDLILNVGSVGALVAVAAPAGGAGGGAAPAAAVEEKKSFIAALIFCFNFYLPFSCEEEPQKESGDDMGFSLFD